MVHYDISGRVLVHTSKQGMQVISGRSYMHKGALASLMRPDDEVDACYEMLAYGFPVNFNRTTSFFFIKLSVLPWNNRHLLRNRLALTMFVQFDK